jgi:dynein heavy chain 1
LFQDRLVTEDEHVWTENLLLDVASKHFPNVDVSKCCATPILYSNFLSRRYAPVNRDELNEFLLNRLQMFYEEELDSQIILFDKALEHVLRIDRVLRQPQGHMMLIGISGFGKSVLTRFVCWMNGVTFFQPSIHPNYTIADFDEDLRTILRRAAVKNERICCMIDESTVKDSAFLEKLNTLLANSEIPELFEGDEHTTLMSACREVCQREGVACDTPEKVYKWFVSQIARNLHVVFAMNPPDEGLSSRVNASPALFNRCVLNWMGDWDQQALYRVGKEFVNKLDLCVPYTRPAKYVVSFPQFSESDPLSDAVVDCMMMIHASVKNALQDQDVKRAGHRLCYVTPRQYLDFVEAFAKMFNEKKEQVEDRQRHLLVGLKKLEETVEQVEVLRSSLRVKQNELAEKTNLANEKLKVIVANQQEAETKKAASEKVHSDLVQQNNEIDARKQVVMEDLAKAEPAVLSAQESVSNIKRQHLNEMRSMVNPPEPVKVTMEAVCILLGHKVDSWKTVQAILRRDDFISSIVHYSTESLSRATRQEVTKTYCSDPNFRFEVVDRASKACGPLYQWVTAQIAYADILEKVMCLIRLGHYVRRCCNWKRKLKKPSARMWTSSP